MREIHWEKDAGTETQSKAFQSKDSVHKRHSASNSSSYKYEILGSLPNFSVPRFPHLRSKANKGMSPHHIVRRTKGSDGGKAPNRPGTVKCSSSVGCCHYAHMPFPWLRQPSRVANGQALQGPLGYTLLLAVC